MSSRVIPYLVAIRSAPSNWLVNSKCSRYLRVIGLPMPACAPAIASEPIGNRLMFSTPHASTMSSAPDEIMLAARFTANWLEPHCESMVEHATSGERPAVSHAVRVTLNACAPTLLMQPPIAWPTAAGGDLRALEDLDHHLGEHFRRMRTRKRAFLFADRRPTRLYNHDFSHDSPPLHRAEAQSRIFSIMKSQTSADITGA